MRWVGLGILENYARKEKMNNKIVQHIDNLLKVFLGEKYQEQIDLTKACHTAIEHIDMAILIYDLAREDIEKKLNEEK